MQIWPGWQPVGEGLALVWHSRSEARGEAAELSTPAEVLKAGFPREIFRKEYTSRVSNFVKGLPL